MSEPRTLGRVEHLRPQAAGHRGQAGEVGGMMNMPAPAERALRWTLTDDEVRACIAALPAQTDISVDEVRERAVTVETYDMPTPGTPVWLAMAQEHPDRRVYPGLVVTRPHWAETGSWVCTAWVQFHANFPGRLIVLGNADTDDWMAIREQP